MGATRCQKMRNVTLAIALSLGTVNLMAKSPQNTAAQNTAGSSSQAPGAPASATQAVLKVVHVKYADVYRLTHLLNFFNVQMSADSALKVITLSGPPVRVQAVEEAIKQLDVPAPPAQDIVITGYLLMATSQTSPETANVQQGSWTLPEMAGSGVPSQLDEVINQLKRVLNYKEFSVVDALTLRTVDGGRASVSGLTPIGRAYGYNPPNRNTLTLGANFQADVNFRVSGGANIIRREGTSSVSLRGLELIVTPRYAGRPAMISTDIDVGQNQQVVVGKTDVLSPDLALFLVISAKITD
jgi:type II secretory pathway component GspD/PulD (secretin)